MENVWDVLEKHHGEIPSPVATELKVGLTKTIESIREQSEWTKSQSGLLGAMATVGSTAIAFDHQLNQQLSVLEHHASTLDNVIANNRNWKNQIGAITVRIKNWIQMYARPARSFHPLPTSATGQPWHGSGQDR